MILSQRGQAGRLAACRVLVTCACAHSHTSMTMDMHTHAWARTHKCLCICRCQYAHMDTHAHIPMYLYDPYMHKHACTLMYTCTHRYTYAHKYKGVYVCTRSAHINTPGSQLCHSHCYAHRWVPSIRMLTIAASETAVPEVSSPQVSGCS